MNAIQLSLTPETGWGLLGPGGDIEEDDETGEPMLLDEVGAHRYKREIQRMCASFELRVVKIERHPAVEGANGLPTYVVL